MYNGRLGLVACTSILALTLTCQHANANSQGRLHLFDELCDIVEKHFYSTEKIATVFRAVRPAYRTRVAGASTQREFASLINRLLSQLKTSHTTYLTRDDPAYYHLAAIFHRLPNIRELFAGQDITYPSIGVLTRSINGKTFIASVLADGPAAKAGVLTGDELVAVNQRPYAGVASFRGYEGRPVTLDLRRHAGAKLIRVRVKPELVNPKREFLEAQRASIRVTEEHGKKIGYIHIWSYAGREYQDAFEEAISMGALKDADGLIWDLRDGWGGASASYLNIFNPNIPVYTRIDRDGNEFVWDTQWRKPVVMLTNGGVRSGKEMLAFGFKKHKLGKIVGESTAGAATAGRLFVLSDGSMLYLAVGGARIDDVVLEGNGVVPDVPVPMDIRYLAGEDRQLRQAIDTLKRMLAPASNAGGATRPN